MGQRDCREPHGPMEALPHAASGPERTHAELTDAEQESPFASILAELPESEPPRYLRERLIQSATELPRLLRFSERVAELLDVTLEQAQYYLQLLDHPENYRALPFPGISRMPVRGGDRTVGALTEFIKIEPGCLVPIHEHLGPEQVLILQGRGQDEAGHVFASGDFREAGAGTRHAITGLPISDCVMLVLVEKGLKFEEFEEFEVLPDR